MLIRLRCITNLEHGFLSLNWIWLTKTVAVALMSLLQRKKPQNSHINMEPKILITCTKFWMNPCVVCSTTIMASNLNFTRRAARAFVLKTKHQTFYSADGQSRQNESSLRTLEATENSRAHPLASPTPANQLLLPWMADTYSSSGMKAGKNIWGKQQIGPICIPVSRCPE